MDGAADRERLEQEKKEAKLEKLRKVAEVNFYQWDFLVNIAAPQFLGSAAQPRQAHIQRPAV